MCHHFARTRCAPYHECLERDFRARTMRTAQEVFWDLQEVHGNRTGNHYWNHWQPSKSGRIGLESLTPSVPISLAIIVLPTRTTLAGAMMFETNLAKRVNGILFLVCLGGTASTSVAALAFSYVGKCFIFGHNHDCVLRWKKSLSIVPEMLSKASATSIGWTDRFRAIFSACFTSSVLGVLSP